MIPLSMCGSMRLCFPYTGCMVLTGTSQKILQLNLVLWFVTHEHRHPSSPHTFRKKHKNKIHKISCAVHSKYQQNKNNQKLFSFYTHSYRSLYPVLQLYTQCGTVNVCYCEQTNFSLKYQCNLYCYTI